MKQADKDIRRKKEKEAVKLLFEKKIEQDRLGISRIKQKRVMRFMTYRIIKIALLALTGIMLFIYTPAVLPLTVLIALMLFVTKRIEKEKNRNVNKKYRIKIKAADSIIAIIMIVLTLGVTSYSLVYAYMNDGKLNTTAAIEQRLIDHGFDTAKIDAALERITGGNAYETIAKNALSLLTGNRDIFSERSGFSGRPHFSGTRPPMNFEGMDGSMPMRRPSVFRMMRNMPLDMLFQQIFNMVCAVAVGIIVIIGIINVIESFKYGEIKRVTLDKRFATPTGPNDLCPCGSGRKIKNCHGNQAYLYIEDE